MNEQCEADGKTTVQGKRWQSVIAFGSRDFGPEKHRVGQRGSH
jgi:hypothetical protein